MEVMEDRLTFCCVTLMLSSLKGQCREEETHPIHVAALGKESTS